MNDNESDSHNEPGHKNFSRSDLMTIEAVHNTRKELSPVKTDLKTYPNQTQKNRHSEVFLASALKR